MSTNPFASPQSAPFAPQPATPTFKPIESIQYLRMYNYVFENPNWLTNVLLLALCGLIPIIGPLVQLGYQYEIAISLLMTGGTRYPDFDFNKFADYLMRGLWPFLVQLVASLVVVPVLMVFWIVPFFLLMALGAAAGEDVGPVIFVIGFPLLILLMILISVGLAAVLLPMQIRAGLSQDFGSAFNFGWVLDFVKKTWKEMLLGLLFLAFTAIVLLLLGYVACFIGVLVTMPIVVMAQAHLLYELYLLFLSRGGEAVPIKFSPGPAQPH